MRILIAEDDFTSRTALAGVLKKEGHEVTATVNGAEAWQALQQPDAPALAILDWMMPEMNGLEVVRRVRALPTDRPPHLIMLTTKSDKADIIAGLEAGANDYLAKPFARRRASGPASRSAGVWSRCRPRWLTRSKSCARRSIRSRLCAASYRSARTANKSEMIRRSGKSWRLTSPSIQRPTSAMASARSALKNKWR